MINTEPTNEIAFSSNTTIGKSQNTSTKQRNLIETVKSFGGMNAIEKAFNDVAKLSVTVVGEPIIDIYKFVTPEGISSKSPTVSARYLYEEEYEGGSLAITRGTAFFTKTSTLHVPQNQSIRKIRYVSGNIRIFEVTEAPEDFWNGIDQKKYLDEFFVLTKKSDIVIVADFGHGMFDNSFLQALKDTKTFISLNVQTNSSNHGFNLFTKHSRFNYLCVDTREARLGMYDRESPAMDVAKSVYERVRPSVLSITLGPNGASLFDEGRVYSSPAFADSVIDATGAGDHYFFLTSLLLKTGCPREIIPFVGCVYGALKCKILGNRKSPSNVDLIGACAAILR